MIYVTIAWANGKKLCKSFEWQSEAAIYLLEIQEFCKKNGCEQPSVSVNTADDNHN